MSIRETKITNDVIKQLKNKKGIEILKSKNQSFLLETYHNLIGSSIQISKDCLLFICSKINDQIKLDVELLLNHRVTINDLKKNMIPVTPDMLHSYLSMNPCKNMYEYAFKNNYILTDIDLLSTMSREKEDIFSYLISFKRGRENAYNLYKNKLLKPSIDDFILNCRYKEAIVLAFNFSDNNIKSNQDILECLFRYIDIRNPNNRDSDIIVKYIDMIIDEFEKNKYFRDKYGKFIYGNIINFRPYSPESIFDQNKKFITLLLKKYNYIENNTIISIRSKWKHFTHNRSMSMLYFFENMDRDDLYINDDNRHFIIKYCRCLDKYKFIFKYYNFSLEDLKLAVRWLNLELINFIIERKNFDYDGSIFSEKFDNFYDYEYISCGSTEIPSSFLEKYFDKEKKKILEEQNWSFYPFHKETIVRIFNILIESGYHPDKEDVEILVKLEINGILPQLMVLFGNDELVKKIILTRIYIVDISNKSENLINYKKFDENIFIGAIENLEWDITGNNIVENLIKKKFITKKEYIDKLILIFLKENKKKNISDIILNYKKYTE